MSDPAFVAGLRPFGTGPLSPADQWPASDIVGVDPTGSAVEVLLDRYSTPLLLAFLHTNCDGCEGFWQGLRSDTPDELSPSVSSLVVTRGPDSVDARQVAVLSSAIIGSPVVMSDATWSAYRVLSYPFFVLVDPVRRVVVGETVGFGWADVRSMVEASGY